MKKKAISVTEAARTFADCVNRVHYQDVEFVLLKNGMPVALLVPDREKTCTGRELAEALKGLELSENEARAWRHELRSSRKRLKKPLNKWK